MNPPAAKKSPASGANGAASSTAPRTPTKAGASTSGGPSTPNGMSKTRPPRTTGTPLSARAAVKKPSSTLANSTGSLDAADEDARAETAALMEDLKERLQRAENASEEYQKQVQVLHTKLEEAIKEQQKLEERLHEEEERGMELANDKREALRQQRELENINEAERLAVMKEKEATHAREEEFHEIIARLKDSLSRKDTQAGAEEEGRSSRNSSLNVDSSQFAPSAGLSRSNSRNNSKLLLQKDKVIESLRLELADAQIKMVGLENMGDTRLHELERTLLETRMANARLMEDNESFQLLLSEKTLNGDFSRSIMRESPSDERAPSRGGPPPTSLADELGSFVEDDEAPSATESKDRIHEREINALKEQNKALTLYINKIIERLLQHQGFETILSNTQEPPHGSPLTSPSLDTNKALPPPPKEKDTGPSLLQRAQSIVRPRPQSVIIPKDLGPVERVPTMTENPDTAPSIPLKRTNSNRMSTGTLSLPRRTPSGEWGNSSAAAVVANMYKGGDGAPPSVGSPGIVSPRGSFFGNPGMGSRLPSNQSIPEAQNEDGDSSDNDDENTVAGSKRNSQIDAALLALEGGSNSTSATAPPTSAPGNTSSSLDPTKPPTTTTTTSIDTPSPPRSTTSGHSGSLSERQGGGAVMAGNKIRPLRLVNQNDEAEKAKKAQNRQTWFGGLFGGVDRGKGVGGGGGVENVPPSGQMGQQPQQ
ncbi:hypothetical protein K402DRAFT_461715 [Aulographum hederae CBS 113979]|uniref:M serotype protein n=1 Tax=Aulographum hederae CBS 113979 TaxID=1176131 RepID=A0A6G1H6V6_9PEZI|nr:hypothetical protein K402DRAFT_461715 [Aulographum hederae CBS 113979]